MHKLSCSVLFRSQTGIEFLRIKSQPDTRQKHGHCSSEAKAPSKELEHGDPAALSGVESCCSDTETDSVLHKLQYELEEERTNCQRICAELAEEIEKHQHVLSLLEKEKKSREDERQENNLQLQVLQTQLSQVQSQCLEMQQYKEEKEKLNKEVADLRKRLQVDAEEKRFSEEMFNSEAIMKLKEEHREEMDKVRQLLEEKEKALKFREEEAIELKALKTRQNQEKSSVSCEDRRLADDDILEHVPDKDSLNGSVPGDIMMERYWSSAPFAHSQSSVVSDFEHHSQLDISADYRLEDILYAVYRFSFVT